MDLKSAEVNTVKVLIPFEGKSQYSPDIAEAYRPSACGPTTAYVMTKQLGETPPSVNDLYKQLKGTRIGLFGWRFIKYMRKLLGPSYDISRCSLHEALEELRQGRSVAAKFDKYFNFHWFNTYTFSYHWVPVIGYEVEHDHLFLYVHDNGGRDRESRIRKVSYGKNAEILTFIKIKPLK